MTPYLNRSDLADSLASAVRHLRQEQGQEGGSAHSVQSAPLSDRRWRMVDRLSKADIEQLIAAFGAGTPKRELAERYDISESSIKRLIRQHGESKPSDGLVRWLWWYRRSIPDVGIQSPSQLSSGLLVASHHVGP